MNENMIKVLKVEVGQTPIVKEIVNDLHAVQAEVGGMIDCVYLDDGCIAVVNDEGKLNGLQPNRRICKDIICGPFFICGENDGDFSSLTEDQIQKYSHQFAEIEQFTGEEPELKSRCRIIFFHY